MRDFFNEFVQVEGINLLKGQNGRNKGVAYITVSSEADVQKALAQSETEF